MLEPLTRPFKRHYDKYRGKLDGFVGPVKESVSKLMAMIPKGEAFAGSEDMADECEGDDAAKPVGLKGFVAKIKDFKKSIKGLSDFQKLILLTIAVVLPAGILIAVALASLLKRKK